MRVIVISDINTSKSIATLSFGVGSYDDNDTHGLAHVVEHLHTLDNKQGT